MKFGLQDEIIKKIKNIFEKYKNIEKIYIYGSRAKGTNTRTSDIDLAVCGKNFKELSKLRSELDDLSIIYTIDLVHLDNLENEKLISQIKKYGKIFYKYTAHH